MPSEGRSVSRRPDNWETVVGGSVISTFVASGFSYGAAGRTAKAWACVCGVSAILIIVAIIVA